MTFLLLKKGWRKQLNRCGAALFILLALWSFCFSFIHDPRTSRDTAELLMQFSAVGGILSTSVFVLFAMIFTDNKFLIKYRLYTLLILFVPSIALILTQWFSFSILAIESSVPQHYGWPTVLQHSITTYLYYAYTYCFVAYVFYILFDYSQRCSYHVRRRQAYIIITSGIATFLANTTAALCSEWLGGPLPHLLDVAFLFWAIGMLYASVHFNLFTITTSAAAETIIDIMSDALLIVDPVGVIQETNKAARTLLGVQHPDILTGQPLSRFFPCIASSQESDTSFISKQVRGIETECSCADGKKRTILFSNSIFFDSNDLPLGCICILHDITQLRRLEREVVEAESREQLRIGHDLHDGLGQLLTGISFKAKALERKSIAHVGFDASEIAEISRLISVAANQVRDLAKGLVPGDKREEGLTAALQALAADIQNMYGIQCSFTCQSKTVRHSQMVITHLYRIAQEAVTNAIKHGRAENISISVEETDTDLLMAVCDDGVGVTSEAYLAGGIGMHSMRYRSRTIGAHLDIRPVLSGGTIVKCTVQKERSLIEPNQKGYSS